MKKMMSGMVRKLWNTGAQEVPGDAPEATEQAQSFQRLPGVSATPEAVEKLKRDIGMDTGSAYSSFMTILRTMEAAIPDARVRYATALELAAKTQAVSREMILEHFTTMCSKLDGAATAFLADLKALTERTVVPRQDSLTQLSALIAAKHAELASLEDRASEEQRRLKDAEYDIQTIGARFQAAHDAVRTELVVTESQFKTMLDIT